MTRKLSLTFFALICFLQLAANDRSRIALDRHFNPLEKSQHDSAYVKVVNPITDGKQVERIYDLENKLVRIVSHHYDGGKKPYKTIREDVDATGEVFKISEQKQDEKYFTTRYFHSGELVAEFYGNEQIVVFGKRVINGETVVTSTNVFEPGFSISPLHFQEFIRENIVYRSEDRKKNQPVTVKLALEIKADGELGLIEVVNATEISPVLQKEAMRVMSLYTDGFRSAIDFDGNPVTKWLYIPLCF